MLHEKGESFSKMEELLEMKENSMTMGLSVKNVIISSR
jgi:hypothetical protein